MSGEQMQMFGGDWTQQKLEMLKKYLAAYTTALKDKPFELVYIDAFAGTGYREAKSKDVGKVQPFFELAEEEPQQFLDGSARIALQVQPNFHKYVFVEKSPKRFKELVKLKDEYLKLADRIDLEEGDCNDYLQHICRDWNWRRRRAVLFLDPFGMQVDWETLEAVAGTKAIDVWIVFPLSAVNRVFQQDGKIPDSWRQRVDRIFGTSDWYEHFYDEKTEHTFFGDTSRTRKVSTFTSISEYYNKRLKSIFAQVAENPRVLCNSRRSPLFLLCFAAGNPRGAPIAIRIARHILKG